MLIVRFALVFNFKIMETALKIWSTSVFTWTRVKTWHCWFVRHICEYCHWKDLQPTDWRVSARKQCLSRPPLSCSISPGIRDSWVTNSRQGPTDHRWIQICHSRLPGCQDFSGSKWRSSHSCLWLATTCNSRVFPNSSHRIVLAWIELFEQKREHRLVV